MRYSRRDALKIGAAASAMALGRSALLASSPTMQPAQLLNTIPSTGELIPVMGLGTHTEFSTAARILENQDRKSVV